MAQKPRREPVFGVKTLKNKTAPNQSARQIVELVETRRLDTHMTILSGLLQELEAKNPSKKTKIHSHFVTQYLPIPTCWNPRICPEQIVLTSSTKVHVDRPDRSLGIEVIKLSNDHQQTNKQSESSPKNRDLRLLAALAPHGSLGRRCQSTGYGLRPAGRGACSIRAC